MYGAIEAGGAKFICGAGTGPQDLQTTRIPTTTPHETVAAALAWLRKCEVSAVGIGSFGPVDLDPKSKYWGHITNTPKSAWRNFDLAGEIGRALNVSVHIDTDVNAAALAEARWGAGRGLPNFLYVTVGSGIGGGAFASGRLLRGMSHPEMGHIRVPHDWERDPYPGSCPFHGDCLEGLASGPAIEERWRAKAADLPDDHPAWELEAQYLAVGLANFACMLSPARILVGGGVMRRQHLYHSIRRKLPEVLKDYVAVPDVGPPELGDRAGVLGALALAENARAEPL
jgi:fructokinase